MQASQQHILTKLLFILFYIDQAVIQAQSINNPFLSTTSTSNGAGSGKARYKTVYACEDRMLHIECEHGTRINLIRANYGRFSITQCNEQGQLDLSTDCVSPITVRIMRRECQDKQSCSVNATSTTFGDKCPKTRKYLEAHFQCVPTSEVSTATSAIETVNLRTSTTPSPASPLSPSSAQTIAHLPSHYEQPINLGGNLGGHVLPPNNVATFDSPFRNGFAGTRGQSAVQQQFASSSANAGRYPQQTQPQAPLPPQNQQPKTVMNSEIVTYNEAMNDLQSNLYGPNNISSNNNNNDSPSSITATFRHIHTDNMSNPRCMLWNQVSGEWTSRGARVIDTNFTHTTCAFDQQTSYLLVMDYLGPQSGSQTVSSLDQNPIPLDQTSQHQAATAPSRIALPSPSDNPNILTPLDSVLPGLLDRQPDPLYQANINFNKNGQPQLQQQSNGPTSTNPSPEVSFFSLFGYLLAFVFVLVALMTIAFVVSSMRSSAGATLKSLGNFTAFSGPKYKSGGARRSDVSLHHHHNKDQLLVINNQNGHQFLYTPTNTTKINSSASTHILTSSLPGQHQGTLHQIQQQQQQQQLYSANGTLSNMSGAGGQSNNYYSYGLTGLNQIFHQQPQQHHLSQHQLSNNSQQQQQQQQQASYHHQANKSTISNESANSSPSSSGVESGSTSMHQQQQHHQQQQQCLVMNNDLNLMNHFGNYGHHQQQQSNNNNSLAAGLSMQDHHTTLTLNAHYNSSVVPMRFGNGGLNPMSTREQHIYECVDDDKNYSARLLMPTADQVFNSNTLNSHHHHHINHQQSNNNVIGQQQQMQMQMGAATRSGAMTLSRFHHQQQQQIPLQQQLQSQLQANKRLISHPAIVRDNQPAAKTNIICSQTAQVTPQRATEINKFPHDMMAIFNNDTASATTTTSTTGASATTSSSLNGNNKLSTDC